MKKTLLIAIAIAAATSVFSQSQNDYDNVVGKFQTFYNNSQPDSVFSLFGERIKGMLPPDKTKEMLTKLHGEFGDLQSNKFTYSDEHFYNYKSTFSKGKLTLVVALNADNKLQSFRFIPYLPDTAGNITLKTPTGDIKGTKMLPAGENKVPVVLIIAGSGPTDRDGNNPMGVKGSTYLMLADSLKSRGIASVRYDKRGIGASAAAATDEEHMSFDDMISDAEGFVKMLKQDDRFSKVIVLGHSEGSLIGMVAAKRANADGYISVAGIGDRADKTIEKQLSAQSADAAAKAKVILDSLVAGYKVSYINPELRSLFRASVMPYMISWLKYDPQVEIKKLNMKALIVQGTTDIQVSVADAEQLKSAYPAAKLIVIKGMNHVLKDAPEDRQANVATYANPSLPLSAGLAPAVAEFVKGK